MDSNNGLSQSLTQIIILNKKMCSLTLKAGFYNDWQGWSELAYKKCWNWRIICNTYDESLFTDIQQLKSLQNSDRQKR